MVRKGQRQGQGRQRKRRDQITIQTVKGLFPAILLSGHVSWREQEKAPGSAIPVLAVGAPKM